MDILCAQFIDFQETLTRDHQKPAQNLIRPEAHHTQIQADTCVLTDQDREDDFYFNSLHAGNFHKPFLPSADFFFKINLFENFFQDFHKSVKNYEPDQAQYYHHVGPIFFQNYPFPKILSGFP